MPKFGTESIRAIAFTGHGGAGKTTLVEALLAKTGAIQVAGSIERGNTVCDFDPLEKKHGHSLYSALVHFTHRDSHVYVVDTPGYPDFLGQAIGWYQPDQAAGWITSILGAVLLLWIYGRMKGQPA